MAEWGWVGVVRSTLPRECETIHLDKKTSAGWRYEQAVSYIAHKHATVLLLMCISNESPNWKKYTVSCYRNSQHFQDRSLVRVFNVFPVYLYQVNRPCKRLFINRASRTLFVLHTCPFKVSVSSFCKVYANNNKQPKVLRFLEMNCRRTPTKRMGYDISKSFSVRPVSLSTDGRTPWRVSAVKGPGDEIASFPYKPTQGIHSKDHRGNREGNVAHIILSLVTRDGHSVVFVLNSAQSPSRREL